jgi:subtilisin-like proprotein convertase family protein
MTVSAAFSPGPTATLPLSLQVFDAAPSLPTLSAPADAAIDVAVNPTLTWTSSIQGDEYILEIATDAAFTNITYTRTVTGTSHAVQTALGGSTEYFWRVRSSNPCGASENSAAASFTTQAFFCVTTPLNIPDSPAAGVTSDLIIPSGTAITDLNMSLVVTHTYVSDLRFALTHVDTGTVVTVIDRPGSCSGDNINVLLDDEAAAAVETQCAAGTPTINGTFRPNSPLSAFDTQLRSGTWRLTATDLAGIDIGTVTSWCLSGTTELVDPELLLKDSFE